MIYFLRLSGFIRETVNRIENGVSMRRLYKGFLAGALAVTMLCSPVSAVAADMEQASDTEQVADTAQTEDDKASGDTVQAKDDGQEEQSCTVSFDANKGKKVKKTLKIAKGDTYGKLPKTTREGYEFLGWYTKKTGGTKVTAKTVFQGKDDQVLYAHWKKTVTEGKEEVPEASAPEEEPETETPAAGQKLVAYTPNSKTDYKQNDYSGFLVLKNFKTKYLYCQYDYKRFASSSGKNVGCTATADAMLASIYMDKPFSPNDEGWISGVGATWTNSVLVSGSKTYSVKRQCQAVYDYLYEGKPVLVRVIGHSVTAIGLRKGVDRTSIGPSDILIADPADGKVKCADEMGYRVMTDASSFGLRIPKASLPAK